METPGLPVETVARINRTALHSARLSQPYPELDIHLFPRTRMGTKT
jgi:hypothetical protein